MTDDIFDSSLTFGKADRVFLTLPVVLGRPSKARGYKDPDRGDRRGAATQAVRQ